MFYKNKDKVDIFLLVHVSDVHSFRNRDHTWRQLGRHRYTHIGIGCVDLMYNDKNRIRVHCIVRRDLNFKRDSQIIHHWQVAQRYQSRTIHHERCSLYPETKYLMGHCQLPFYEVFPKPLASGLKNTNVNLPPAFWRRPYYSNHDHCHPVVFFFLCRTLERSCSPNGLAPTRNLPLEPPGVHFHLRRRQVRYSIDI